MSIVKLQNKQRLNNFAQMWQGRFFEFGIFRCGRAIRFENRPIYTYYRDLTYIHRAPGYYSCLDNSGTRVQMHTFEISAIKLYRADCFERRAILLQDINRNCQIYCDQIVFQLLLVSFKYRFMSRSISRRINLHAL